MKKQLLLIVVPLALLVSCSDSIDLKVVSFNIRFDNPADGVNAWKERREIAVRFLEREQPDIFGLQEALLSQYQFLDSALQEYRSVAAGRNDGLESGEMTPVFYNAKRFTLKEADTFWLSETPDVPGSKGWGAVLPRIVTWVNLYDNQCHSEFFYFNTHFSHMSDSARLMSSKILAEKVREIAGDNLFVITGDFNMLPGSEAYRALTGEGSTLFRDSYLLSETPPSGPVYTFNGFSDAPGSSRIDYIFVREGTSVDSFSTVYYKEDSIFISDHWPVEANLTWDF